MPALRLTEYRPPSIVRRGSFNTGSWLYRLYVCNRAMAAVGPFALCSCVVLGFDKVGNCVSNQGG